MTPVIFLSDGYIANGAEPWKFPKADDLPPIEVKFKTELGHNEENFQKWFTFNANSFSVTHCL